MNIFFILYVYLHEKKKKNTAVGTCKINKLSNNTIK